jgi:hypothetical protein
MEYDSVMQEIDQQLAQLVAKDVSVARLSHSDQLSRLFKRDPGLYERYRRASTAQPAARPAAPARFSPVSTGAAAEALKRADSLVQKDARLTQAEALSRVFADDPQLYQDYRQQAGASAPSGAAARPPAAPVVKVIEHPLAGDLLTLAKLFSPTDPTGHGLVLVRQALHLLQQTVERKRAAA